MRKYEMMYILNSSLEEAVRQQTIDQLNAIITDGKGTVDNVDEEHWGMRDLAYKIDNMTKGYYVVVTFHADNAIVNELDRICRISSNVVRNMIVNLDE